MALDALLVRCRDHRTVIRLRVLRRADAQAGHGRDQAPAQRDRSVLADRHHHRQGHAAFARGAEGGSDNAVDGLVQVGVRQHHTVVLGPAHGLNPLAAGRGGHIDVLRHLRRADKTHGLDLGGRQDRLDHFAVALHDVQEALGCTGFVQQRRQLHRHRGRALRGFQDERIAGSEGRSQHPQRDHRREVERGDAGDDAQRLAHRPHIDPRSDPLGKLALEQLRCAADEVDHFESALQVPTGIGEYLAVFAGEQFREAPQVLLDQAFESEQHL